MSKVEIKFTFNKGARPDKEKVSSLASHALGRLDIGYEGGKVHAGLGSTYTITAEGATGIDLDTLVMLGFVPGDHTAQIRVHRHPDGPAAAVRWAGELAGRIAEAFNVRIVKATAHSDRLTHAVVDLKTEGWQGQFRKLTASWEPKN